MSPLCALLVLCIAAGCVTGAASRAYVTPKDIVDTARRCAQRSGFTCQGKFSHSDLKQTLGIEERVFALCARQHKNEHAIVVLQGDSGMPNASAAQATWHAYKEATADEVAAITACTTQELQDMYNRRA